jgi:CheY-like chemotaxis protein
VAIYDFQRLNVLFVEDNHYIRTVFETVLRQFQVGYIETAKNGAEAVEILKLSERTGELRGLRDFDLVISDLLMTPVDGLLLLRWIRTGKDSPNRFLPFIMLSGAADAHYVGEARDFGANEFLAKPFSAESVYKRLLQVIDHPRPYIATQSYFGPNRRRRNLSPPGQERRVIDEANIAIVYSADRVVKPEMPTEVWEFRLSNRLRDKVAGLGVSGNGEIPLNLLEEAEAQLQRAALDFTEWARGYLTKLGRLCEQALEQPSGRRRYFEDINMLAHELRGQGGTFGYPLISIFGKMLYDATGANCREDDNMVEIVRAHIDAMRAVLRDKVSGDGGMVGRELLASLKAAIRKRMQAA